MVESLAVVYEGPDRGLATQRIACPSPGAGEVLVRVVACTLCGSDLHTVDGRRETPVPTILGHEIVGEVVEVGPEPPCDLAGEPLGVGQRVTWSIVASCGDCLYCSRSLPQKCARAVKYGHEQITAGRELTGGLAEYCVLAAGTGIVGLSDALPLEVATPANCATATVAAAVAHVGDLTDRDVCIFGAGMLGLTATAMARVGGATSVVCVDVNDDRLQLAKRFGATSAVAPSELESAVSVANGGAGFDVTLEFSGSPVACTQALQALRLGGTCALVGSVFPTEPLKIVPEQIVRRNLTIHGVHNYGPVDLLQAVQFLERNHQQFPFAELVSRWYPLESAADAFEAAHDSQAIRIGVHP